MTSGGLTLPEPGYLAAVRALTRRHGVVLIFDEVKTGLTIAAGGAVERLGGDPDIVTLAKSLSGGLPAGAVGMTADFERLLANGDVRLMGTYNGNPLEHGRREREPAGGAHARRLRRARAARRADGRRLRTRASTTRAQAPPSCPLAPRAASGGAATSSWDADLDLADEPRHLHDAGREQEWNVSVAHDERTVDRYMDAFGAFLAELSSTIVRLCSRMNCGRYQAPSPPLPVEPLDFHPQKVCVPGQAPVVAPARLFT